jgi:hypothetical protein
MPRFLFLYRAPANSGAGDAGTLAAWQDFFSETVGPRAVDPGWPVFESTTPVGETGEATRLGGYSVIETDDLTTAVAMARQCPTLSRGGGVEVAPLAQLPDDHIAERMRSGSATR